jgi:hypothetical protein
MWNPSGWPPPPSWGFYSSLGRIKLINFLKKLIRVVNLVIN